MQRAARSRVSFVYFVMGYAFTCGAYAAESEAPLEIRPENIEHDLGVLDTEEIDFGEIDEGLGQLRFRFRWLNKSKRRLTIDKAVSGCKCQSVTVSPKVIEAGGLAEYHVVVNLLGVYGNGGTAFVVTFKNDERDPLGFRAAFYRPFLPHAEPERIEFGTIASPDNVTRELVISWVASDEGSGVRLLDGISATDPWVSCRASSDERQTSYRLANAMQDSVRYRITFEATAIGGSKGEEFEGTITIPLVYRNDKMVVAVPYHGRCAGDVVARPSRIVLFAAKDERSKEASILLYRGTDTQFDTLTCVCSDPRVTLDFVCEPSSTKSDIIGKTIVKIDLSDGESFDTEIAVRPNGSSYCLRIPVRVRVVP